MRQIEVRQSADGSKQPLVELSQVVVGQAEALKISQTQQRSRGNGCYGVVGQIKDADDGDFSESH